MPSSKKAIRDFSTEYMEICKTTWYSLGRPTITNLVPKLPQDEFERVPSVQALTKWRKDQMWDFWADELDSKALTIVEDGLISQKVEMLKRHAETARALVESGQTYLKDKGFDSSASAVSAIIKGAELERTSRGFGELYVKMAQMSNDELKDEILKYIHRASENNQIIDVQEVPEKKEDTDTESISVDANTE